MKASEHEKAIIAISSLADQIGRRGEETEDQLLINIASCLNLYLVSAICDEINDFLNYTNDYRDKRIKRAQQEIEDILHEKMTGKKITEEQKILRERITNDN